MYCQGQHYTLNVKYNRKKLTNDEFFFFFIILKNYGNEV